MPEIGDHAPDFELKNQNGGTVRLSDYRGKKVVLFAFPESSDERLYDTGVRSARRVSPDKKRQRSGIGPQP